jgi:hypothetical protein
MSGEPANFDIRDMAYWEARQQKPRPAYGLLDETSFSFGRPPILLGGR